MRLKKQSLEWAVSHVLKEGDTDLFPRPFEFEIIGSERAVFINELSSIDLNQYTWSGPRRLMIPKAEFSFRAACQLDPIDAILFAAIIYEIGPKIEGRRVETHISFSYRFSPDADGRLYSKTHGWEQFWEQSQQLSQHSNCVLVTDISDFYNQIYHHTVENQLDRCGVDRSNYWHAIKNLLANVTEGVSRGIPIGPHPSHLLAELAMNPVDEFIKSLGVPHCRYVDDLHIFCQNDGQAHEILYKLVDFLDKTQKNQINKQKTNIISSKMFDVICESRKSDSPISGVEERILAVIKECTDSPYEKYRFENLSSDQKAQLTEKNIESVLRDYISQDDVDFIRLRWFVRRLAQVGVPGGISFIVNNFNSFVPAISEVAQYFESAAPNYTLAWDGVGEKLIEILNLGIVQASEYLQVVILSMFSRIHGINHVEQLTAKYDKCGMMARRKIVLAAKTEDAAAWLSALKGAYKNSDPWLRRAILYSMSALPKDERSFWVKSAIKNANGSLEKTILSKG